MKKSTIKNVRYRQFLDSGIIETIGEAEIVKVVDNITPLRNVGLSMARCFVILLYYSGARPNELLKLDTTQFRKEGTKYLVVKVVGSKRGLPRSVYLPMKKPLVQELAKYAFSLPPGYKLFHYLANRSVRIRKGKTGKETITIDTTDKLRYYFKKWFSVLGGQAVPPYFLRHNRFSKLAEAGLDLQDLRMLKGSKTFESITPYLHLSKRNALRVAKKLD